MSKMRKPKQQRVNSQRRSVIQTFNIALPNELRMQMMVDITGLYAINAERNHLQAQAVQLQKASVPLQKQDVVPPAVEKAFATIATNAWRAKGKMIVSDTGETKEEMKRVYRHIEAIIEALTQIGVMTIDPVGRAYDSGMALTVVSFEPTPGLSSEEIMETIKPSVAWQGRLIQIGEVIVGTPQTM